MGQVSVMTGLCQPVFLLLINFSIHRIMAEHKGKEGMHCLIEGYNEKLFFLQKLCMYMTKVCGGKTTYCTLKLGVFIEGIVELQLHNLQLWLCMTLMNIPICHVKLT